MIQDSIFSLLYSMADKLPNSERAEGFLRAPLEVTHVDRRVFSLGQSTRDEIITTNRFILILRGQLRYTIEGRALTMGPGTQFLVPAWVRRVWTVPRGGSCEIAWCEFDEGTDAEEWTGFVRRKIPPKDLPREKTAFDRLLREHRECRSDWSRLQLEADVNMADQTHCRRGRL